MVVSRKMRVFLAPNATALSSSAGSMRHTDKNITTHLAIDVPDIFKVNFNPLNIHRHMFSNLMKVRQKHYILLINQIHKRLRQKQRFPILFPPHLPTGL